MAATIAGSSRSNSPVISANSASNRACASSCSSGRHLVAGHIQEVDALECAAVGQHEAEAVIEGHRQLDRQMSGLQVLGDVGLRGRDP